MEVLVLGPHRLDPAHRGGEVAAPGVDEEPLEGRVDLVDEAQRRPDARAGGLLARLHLLDAADQRGDLPVGEAGHGLADTAREVDGRVEVDGARVDEAHEGGDGLDVGGRVGLLAGELREAQRAPQPAGLLDRHAGLGGDLEGVEGRLAAQDRVVSCSPGAPCGPVSGRPPRRLRSGAIVAAVATREAVELVGDLQLDLLDLGDVVEQDAAGGAGVGDDERAAAEDPVDHADLEVDAADPVERDRATLLGDEAGALDEAAVGEGVGRGQPRHDGPHHEPQEDQDGHEPASPPARVESVSRLSTTTAATSSTPTSTGPISALTWDRVETTTCSPGLRSLLGNATRRSCHPVSRAARRDGRARRRPRRP